MGESWPVVLPWIVGCESITVISVDRVNKVSRFEVQNLQERATLIGGALIVYAAANVYQNIRICAKLSMTGTFVGKKIIRLNKLHHPSLLHVN